MQSQKSVSTSLIGASGDCILAFTPQKQIVCAILPSRQKVGVWPYNSLRTYWGGKDQFGFKAGRRSPRGEGEFVFLTAQGEEVYRYLERTVRLTSMAASRPELVDSLPPDPTHSETPVPSSESDEEESPHKHPSPPHVPPKPPDLPKRLSMGPLPLPETPPFMATPTSGTEVSDTSPAYFVNKSSLKHLHRKTPKERIRATERSRSLGDVLPVSQPPAKSQVGPSHSLPPTRGPLPDDNDTYSRATHDLPLRFARKSSADGAMLYQGLVRTDSSRSTTKPSRAQERGGGVGELQLDDQVYDLAYPPNSQQAKVLAPVSEGEYGIMGDAEDQKRELVEKKLVPSGAGASGGRGGKMLSGGNVPFSAQLRQRVESIDGEEKVGHGGLARHRGKEVLTDNPLYDSNENLLSPSFSVGGASYSRDRHHEASTVKDFDLTDSMVTNPVYGEHTPKMLAKGVATGGSVYGEHTPKMLAKGVATGGSVCNEAKRPVSPLENSLVTNPLYGGQQELRMMRLNKAETKVHDSCNQPSQSGGETVSIEPSGKSQDGNNATNVETPGGSGGILNSENSGSPAKMEDTPPATEKCNKLEASPPESVDAEGSRDDAVKSVGLDGKNSDRDEAQVEHITQDSSSPSTDTLDVGTATGAGGKGEGSPSKGEGSPSKGNKGYSRVDKKKKENASAGEQKDGGDQSPPPPIPPRNYSNGTDS